MSGARNYQIQADFTNLDAQKELHDFIRDNRVHPEHNFKSWYEYYFPKPTRSQLVTFFRSFISWVIIAFGFWAAFRDQPLPSQYGVVEVASIFGGVLLPMFPLILQFIIGLVMILGCVVGMSLYVLIEWWVVLYNTTVPNPSYLAAALIIFCSLISFCYVASCIIFNHYRDLWGLVFGNTVVAVAYLMIDAAYGLENLRTISIGVYILAVVACFVTIVECALLILIMPLYACEVVRTQLQNVLQLSRELLETKFILNDGNAQILTIDGTSLQKARKLWNKLIQEQTQMQAAIMLSALDIGWLWDQPLHLAGVAKQLGMVTRHLGALLQMMEDAQLRDSLDSEKSEAYQMAVQTAKFISDEMAIIHDALIVHPGILGQFGWYGNDMGKSILSEGGIIVGSNSPGNVAKASQRNLLATWEAHDVQNFKSTLTQTLAQAKTNWEMEMSKSFTQPTDLESHYPMHKTTHFLYSLSGLLDDVLKLSAMTKAIYKARGTKTKFVIPIKGWPKKGKVPKPPKQAKQWDFYSVCSEFFYWIAHHFTTPASQYAVRRSVCFFLICIWAFIPATAEWFSINHGYWILIGNWVVSIPTVGASWGRIGARICATVVSAAWAVLVGVVSPNAPVDIVLLWAIPVVLGTFYMMVCTQQSYGGRILLVTYNVIALSGPNLPRQAATRAAAQILAVVLALLASIIIYPYLARTASREALAKVLFNTRELFRRVYNASLVEKSELLEKPDFKQSSGLYQTTQALLSQTRSVTLVNAAVEPDVDRPYNQDVMEAIAASCQHLLELFASFTDTHIAFRTDPNFIHVWTMFRQVWGEERQEVDRIVSLYLSAVGNCLITKTPMMPLQNTLDDAMARFNVIGDPKMVLERLKSQGIQASEKDVLDITFAGAMLLSTWERIIFELHRLEALTVLMFGKATWWADERHRGFGGIDKSGIDLNLNIDDGGVTIDQSALKQE